jgi:hypothetical protein
MYYPYLKQQTLLSPDELEFYKNLQPLAEAKSLAIFSKVRLADLVWIPKSYKSFSFFFSTIKAKHIDFVLCDKNTSEIKCLIELDDVTHDLPSRQSRDRFVNKVVSKAGHRFIRCTSKQHYCIEV